MGVEMNEKSLSSVLQAAETPGLPPSASGLQKLADDAAAVVGYAPPPDDVKDAPSHGAAAHRNISIYGEALAQFLDQTAAAAVLEAEAYAHDCRRLATEVRALATSEANRAVRYTKRIRQIATMLDEANKLHSQDI